MRITDDQFTEAQRRMAKRAVETLIESVSRPPYWWRKPSAPSCDCHSCRAVVAAQGAQSAPRTIQQAAAQEAAKPQSERKPAKRRPRSIADEWLDRR